MVPGFLKAFVLPKLDEQVEYFMNSRLEPMVRIAEDGFQQEWSVRSERLVDLLNEIYHKESIGHVLNRTDREFLLSQIRQKCRKGKRCFSQYEADDAEENPIVQAVICYVNDHERFEGRMAVLLKVANDSDDTAVFSEVSSGCRQL